MEEEGEEGEAWRLSGEGDESGRPGEEEREGWRRRCLPI
jgi:hypothetical protein